ncbi:MAG: amidohydrolase [Proteobacteria bacterium]|nr:amidohydrolase [Pseudomonadota bacterium]
MWKWVIAIVALWYAAAGHTAESFAFVNARIYTGDEHAAFVSALVVQNDRIAYVGERGTPEWTRALQPGTRVYDLRRRVVIPGFVDGHTHPALTAMFGSGDPAIDERDNLPGPDRAETLRWLRRYAKAHPQDSPIILSYWDVASFLPEGPDKRDLDAIWPTTPVAVLDNSGHSAWLNSAMLRKLRIDGHTPDVSSDISVYVRDANGEPTGWIKEWGTLSTLAPLVMPPRAQFRARLVRQLNYLAGHGVTSLFDGGNMGMEDAVYTEVSRLDRAGKLPLRYFGSYQVFAPAQLDRAVPEIRRLQATYGGPELRFDTVKLMYDGVFEILTAAMLQPYASDPAKKGGILVDSHRLAQFIQQLDREGLNLHIHVVGDRATHEALDAVEESTQSLGRPPRIQITLAHLQIVDAPDIARLGHLKVNANMTPHWFGGTQFGRAGLVTLGAERAHRDEPTGSIWRSGVNVSFSSDVTSSDEIPRTNPFVGLEMAMTRRDYAGGPDLYARPAMPEECLSLKQSLAAYTLNGARQLGIAAETGSLEAGKKADLVVMASDPFAVPASRLHAAKIAAVVMDGRVTAGSLQ